VSSSGPANVRFGWRIQLIDATPFPSNLARWNDMHMEGHAQTWFTPKQKAELWERWKSGRWVPEVARALEGRKRCLRSWLSMEELRPRHTGKLRRAVLH
jgi:hypothetical protein